MVAAGMPRIRAKAIQTKRPMSVVWALGWRRNVSAAQRRNAATEPQVPGPGLPRPAPKKVAIAQAHHCMERGFWLGALAGALVVIVAALALTAAECPEVFEDFGVEDGGADFVDARGPLAEIDLAAAVGAEWEILAIEGHEHGAGGAAEEFGGFFLGGHGTTSFYRAAV